MAKDSNMTVMITGGAGFIGSALVKHFIENTEHTIVNIDKLTYAGNMDNLNSVINNKKHYFQKIDICDADLINNAIKKHKPDTIIHLAAESHVDRSINSPSPFIYTNIIGTYNLIEASRNFCKNTKSFKFIHISTDEVYGELQPDESPFNENSIYRPSSPYAASKAGSDHLIQSWIRTYGFPAIITHSSNVFGPRQYKEKLIPKTIINAAHGNKITLYGDGTQIRDWVFIDDNIKALFAIFNHGRVGETYNIGGNNEKRNIDVIKIICNQLEKLHENKPKNIQNFENLIHFVDDRPGHDTRYAINADKIQNELEWLPQENFESAIKKTIQWYLDNYKLK